MPELINDLLSSQVFLVLARFVLTSFFWIAGIKAMALQKPANGAGMVEHGRQGVIVTRLLKIGVRGRRPRKLHGATTSAIDFSSFQEASADLQATAQPR
ncbi:hypothetical protein JMJ56_31295 [Belnapia sp. T18]|uniref:Uncharacterized protein n=1 Tax=Belnapia arida TaxID=2804533 RepID=A0ABS1UCS6_9PROT|nr:hypothetical protein [Belnapia arida]MBL6082454.1 hypothetical protein [Belnapia arida]